ncbi:NADPH:quinone oxidoreductase family protein [Deinococcus yavapaiensis]|uniref:NADPH:quinone reductase-like Zn-dependent oxidoreductase n=1 Tax=Deinococcus yavapaiensis KR-236 TaxID=694435 RepID=A0A318SEF0_9DEIO|nr:NADPH:quinone oxidoreductase family protein [Deinococcus yavapaiensis]PYE51128.1 NADPH:quinone reductase-like Zn-dependent oxidoreductase [Deinococcus yavapaiensis KR-236]
MNAVVCESFGPIDALALRALPDPTPGPDEVVIDVKAAGVNYPDALMVQGQYQVKPSLPFVPGAEAAGVVSAVGENVRHVRVGQRVAAFTGAGTFAEKLLAPAANVLPIPDTLTFEVAASLSLAYGTSMHALCDRAKLQSGETMLVLGAAGGVGLAAVMIGKAMGARVIAAASTPEKLAVAEAHGADDVLDYSKEDLRARLKDLTNGLGPDVIYDPVGAAYAEPAFRSIAWGGRYLVVGFAGGDIPKLPLNLPLLKGASLVGVFWGEFARRDPGGNARNITRLASWIAEGKVRPVISERYPLDKTPEALRALLERRVVGKVVVTP